MMPDAEFDSFLTIGLDGPALQPGSLSTVGLNLASWSESRGVDSDNGAVFFMDPTHGATTEPVVFAQLTVATGSEFSGSISAQGKSSGGREDWVETRMRFNRNNGVPPPPPPPPPRRQPPPPPPPPPPRPRTHRPYLVSPTGDPNPDLPDPIVSMVGSSASWIRSIFFQNVYRLGVPGCEDCWDEDARRDEDGDGIFEINPPSCRTRSTPGCGCTPCDESVDFNDMSQVEPAGFDEYGFDEYGSGSQADVPIFSAQAYDVLDDGTRGEPIEFADDLDGDVPPCPAGTDVADCSGGTCRYENDGECDAGTYCPAGTDVADCSGGTCRYENDGECDAGTYWVTMSHTNRFARGRWEAQFAITTAGNYRIDLAKDDEVFATFNMKVRPVVAAAEATAIIPAGVSLPGTSDLFDRVTDSGWANRDNFIAALSNMFGVSEDSVAIVGVRDRGRSVEVDYAIEVKLTEGDKDALLSDDHMDASTLDRNLHEQLDARITAAVAVITSMYFTDLLAEGIDEAAAAMSTGCTGYNNADEYNCVDLSGCRYDEYAVVSIPAGTQPQSITLHDVSAISDPDFPIEAGTVMHIQKDRNGGQHGNCYSNCCVLDDDGLAGAVVSAADATTGSVRFQAPLVNRLDEPVNPATCPFAVCRLPFRMASFDASEIVNETPSLTELLASVVIETPSLPPLPTPAGGGH
jgi:hypothetical protein